MKFTSNVAPVDPNSTNKGSPVLLKVCRVLLCKNSNLFFRSFNMNINRLTVYWRTSFESALGQLLEGSLSSLCCLQSI